MGFSHRPQQPWGSPGRADQEADVDDSSQQPQDQPDDSSTAADDGIVEELLVEEVSIDGMCGVY